MQSSPTLRPLPPKRAGVRKRVAKANKPSSESSRREEQGLSVGSENNLRSSQSGYTRKGKRERKRNRARAAERIEKTKRERDESDERTRGAAWWVRLTKFQKEKQSVGAFHVVTRCHCSVGLRCRW